MDSSGIKCTKQASTIRLLALKGDTIKDKRITLKTIYSPKLIDIINITNKKSNNLYAEHLLSLVGYAKNKMLNSIKIAAKILDQLPKDRFSPETTEKREGYVHPNTMTGGVEETTIKFLIRDFTVKGLHGHEAFLKNLAEKIVVEYPKAQLEFKVEESYRNMKYKLDDDPKVVEYALEAVKRSGIEPIKNIIRGGTDGARLSFDGLLTPNIFTGGHNFHSKLEWISIQDMQKAVEVIVNLVKIWTEK